jgi:hypothetical protein
MWMDSRGVTHTVALADPSRAMSVETVESLDSLSNNERVQVLQVLDDFYWNNFLGNFRSRLIASDLAPEGASLPDGFVTATILNAHDALCAVRFTEPAWRIDVLEVIKDYLEQAD